MCTCMCICVCADTREAWQTALIDNLLAQSEAYYGRFLCGLVLCSCYHLGDLEALSALKDKMDKGK